MGAYPKPEEPGWEDKYRYAYAKDEVYGDFMKRIQSWAKEAEDIDKQDSQEVKSIV